MSGRFKPGDHLKVSRGIFAHPRIYTHHGIYVGGWLPVIHYPGEVFSDTKSPICRVSFEAFAADGDVEVVRYGDCLPAEETIRRAESRLGEREYSVVTNNCEHFARWCKTGQDASEQVKDVVSTVGGGVGATAAATAGLATVASGGVVAGVSGAGIMSGLAAVGGAVGAGAVGGVVALGAAPAAASVAAMTSVLKHDNNATAEENEAREAGRIATKAGAAAGLAGSVGAISVAGSVAGLSGAGITSGLAAIGGTVGCGMMAGTVMTVAAPAVAAAGLGYGIYNAWKWLGG